MSDPLGDVLHHPHVKKLFNKLKFRPLNWPPHVIGYSK